MPRNTGCPAALYRTGSGNLGLLLLRGLEIDGFLAANKADDKQSKCDGAPDAHGLDPGGLIVAEQLDDRHGEGYGNDLANGDSDIRTTDSRSRSCEERVIMVDRVP